MYTKKYRFNMLLQYMYSTLYLTSIESIPEVAFYVYEQIKIIKETKTRLASERMNMLFHLCHIIAFWFISDINIGILRSILCNKKDRMLAVILV